MTISRRNTFPAAAACVLAAATASSSAAIIPFTAFENSAGANLAGLNLFAEITDAGPAAVFTFYNTSTIPSVITAIYFESAAPASAALTSPSIVAPHHAGVSFSPGAAPASPHTSVGNWAGNLFALDADNPKPHKGIGPGESLTVSFSYTPGTSFTDVIAAFTADANAPRIAQHVQSLSGGASVWTVTQIPEPGVAAILGMAALSAGRRRSNERPA